MSAADFDWAAAAQARRWSTGIAEKVLRAFADSGLSRPTGRNAHRYAARGGLTKLRPLSHVARATKRYSAARGEAAMNSLLASSSLASWRQGTTLDVAEWVEPKSGKKPIVVISVAHLDDEERTLVLGVLLEELLSWVRSLPGSQKLRALLVFDEVYGFLPPHPANPPTKRPVVALTKQARAFGVGVIVATQNPMDLDYRALSNAGVWCLGRLQNRRRSRPRDRRLGRRARF